MIKSSKYFTLGCDFNNIIFDTQFIYYLNYLVRWYVVYENQIYQSEGYFW